MTPEDHMIAGEAGWGTVVQLPPVEGLLEYECRRDGCRFRRSFGTPAGAKRGISEHLLQVHRVQAVWHSEPPAGGSR